MEWVIDGNNVMGAVINRWWTDPSAAAAELAAAVARWCRDRPDEPVRLVFDGPDQADLLAVAGGNLVVECSQTRRRDGADDVIVERVEARFADPGSVPEVTVVSSDRGLVARLPPGVATVGAGTFGRWLDLGASGRAPSGRARRQR